MKAFGIVLLVLGILSTMGQFIAASQGQNASFVGCLAFIAIGAYLMHRANKNKEEAEHKRQWESSGR